MERRGYHKGRQQLSPEERKQLALQITSRKKESDAYLLDAFLTAHPVLTSIMGNAIGSLIAEVVKAMAVYTKKQFYMFRQRETDIQNMDTIRQPTLDLKFEFVANLYPEVLSIANRVNSVSGVSRLEISTQDESLNDNITFDEDVRDYIRNLANEEFLGSETTLVGKIESLNIPRQSAEVRSIDGRVNVEMGISDFQRIRYDADEESIVTFRGHFIIIIGKSTHGKLKFRATSIERIHNPRTHR